MSSRRSFMVDHHPYRLDFAARTYGVEPIDFDECDDPAGLIVERTDFRGVDASIDSVGFEAKGSTLETVLTTLKLEGSSGKSLRQAMAATRRGGIVSVPGVYAGFVHGFLFGEAFEKGLTFKGGQTHTQRYMPELLEHIARGDLKPGVIVSHTLPLADAARGYEFREQQEDAARCVILEYPSRERENGTSTRVLPGTLPAC